MTETRQSGSPNANLWIAPRVKTRVLVPDNELAKLEVLVPTRTYGKGQAVFRAGGEAIAFHLVLAGGVKVIVPGTTSGERIVAVNGPSDLFGTSACTSGREYRSEAVAIEHDTRVASVACEQFGEITRELPGMAVAVTTALAERVEALEAAVEWATLPSQVRLARTFLSLTRRFGVELEEGVLDFALDLKQSEIASLAATTRVSATRALGAWRELGIVEGTRGSYRVHVTKLTALADLLEQEHID